jgi:hypothetical protein
MLCSSIVLYLLDHEKKTAEKIIDNNEIDYNNKGRGVFRALLLFSDDPDWYN